jgi:thiamine biosynthesis lipoprotein
MAQVGSPMLHVRRGTATTAAALRKDHPDLTIDLSAIGPGYAVDAIGDRLTALGSASHLVELGGEVRGWGTLVDGRPWQVGIASGPEGTAVSQQISLRSGEAVAVVQHVPTRPIIDPRTGQCIDTGSSANGIIIAATCAEADARATASLLPINP